MGSCMNIDSGVLSVHAAYSVSKTLCGLARMTEERGGDCH